MTSAVEIWGQYRRTLPSPSPDFSRVRPIPTRSLRLNDQETAVFAGSTRFRSALSKRKLKGETSKRKDVNTALMHHKGSLLFGRDREGTVHLTDVPCQAVWKDRMNVYHQEADFSEPNVLLLRETGVDGQ